MGSNLALRAKLEETRGGWRAGENQSGPAGRVRTPRRGEAGRRWTPPGAPSGSARGKQQFAKEVREMVLLQSHSPSRSCLPVTVGPLSVPRDKQSKNIFTLFRAKASRQKNLKHTHCFTNTPCVFLARSRQRMVHCYSRIIRNVVVRSLQNVTFPLRNWKACDEGPGEGLVWFLMSSLHEEVFSSNPFTRTILCGHWFSSQPT